MPLNFPSTPSNGQVYTDGSSGLSYTYYSDYQIWRSNDATLLPSGTNTYVQFNDSGLIGGDSGFVYDKTTDTISVTNATSNVQINPSSIVIGNSLGTSTVNSTFFTGTANNATFLNNVDSSLYVNTSGNYTLSGNLYYYSTNNYFYSGLYSSIPTASDFSFVNRTSNVSNTLYGVAFGNGIYVSVGWAGITATSNDGITWTSRTSIPSFSIAQQVAFGNGTFVATGLNNSSQGSAYISKNNTPSSWQGWTLSTPSNTTPIIRGMVFGNGIFVGVGDGGSIQTYNGTTWSNKVSANNNIMYDVAYGNNLFVAVGASGAIQTSPDGTSWTNQNSAGPSDLYTVTYGNGLFVAGGLNGGIQSSANGTSWTNQTPANTNTILSMSYSDGLFIGTGNAGSIVTSPDGVNWTNRTTANTNTMRHVTSGNVAGNNLFVLVGNSASLQTSIVPRYVTTLISPTTISISNSTANLQANITSIRIGNTTQNSVYSQSAVTLTDNTGSLGDFVYTSSQRSVIISPALGGWIGTSNGTVSSTITPSSVSLVANSSATALSIAATGNVTIPKAIVTTIYANNALGSNGLILASNSTGGAFWSKYLPRANTQTTITSPLAWNSDNFDMYITTAQSTAFTINADSGSPSEGQKAMFRFLDNGTTRTITFTGGVSKGFKPVGVSLTASGSNFTYATIANKTVYFGCIYNTSSARWEIIAQSEEA